MNKLTPLFLLFLFAGWVSNPGGSGTTFTGGTVAGQTTFTRDPASTATSDCTILANPATSAVNEKFLCAQDNASDVFTVDKEGDMTLIGNITMTALKTIDGRDVSVDGTKLDGLPTSAYSTVGVDGTSQTQRGRINKISGTGIALTVADNSGTNSTDVTTALSYSNTLAGNPALTTGQSTFASTGVIFEGSTADTSEGLLTPTDPTADRTWTLPDVTGTVSVLDGLVSAAVQTTDNTQTTCGTLTIASNTAIRVKWDVMAMKSDNTSAGAYSRVAQYRNNAGTVALVGAVALAHGADQEEAGISTADFTIDNSTTTIRGRVTGIAATTINWHCVGTILATTP